MSKRAVLMMTFGSPEEITYEGVAEFFTNIRRGVRPEPHEIQTLYDNYVRIGGTPLQRITREEVDMVATALGNQASVYFANKFSRPFITDVIKEMELDGNKLSTKFMIRYTLRQLMEGSVLTQTIIAAGILPYLLLLPTVLSFSGGPTEISFMNFLNLNTFLPFAMLITFIAFFNTGGNNLLAVGISLERENYYYLKVLPFDMHQFLERKFWILFAIQSAIPVILMTVICMVLRLPIYMTLGIILSWGIISLGLSRWGYARDLKLFTPTWTNVIELLNRSRSGVKSIIVVGVLFGFIFGAIYLLIHLPEWNRTFVWFITIAYVVLILGLSIFATFYYKKKLHELVDSE